jgi:hypothetical protein
MSFLKALFFLVVFCYNTFMFYAEEGFNYPVTARLFYMYIIGIAFFCVGVSEVRAIGTALSYLSETAIGLENRLNTVGKQAVETVKERYPTGKKTKVRDE